MPTNRDELCCRTPIVDSVHWFYTMVPCSYRFRDGFGVPAWLLSLSWHIRTSLSGSDSTWSWGVLLNVWYLPPPPHRVGHQQIQQKGRSNGASGGRPPGISIFLLQDKFLQRLNLSIEVVGIHNTHVVNDVRPYLPYFLDQKVSSLIHIIPTV